MIQFFSILRRVVLVASTSTVLIVLRDRNLVDIVDTIIHFEFVFLKYNKYTEHI